MYQVIIKDFAILSILIYKNAIIALKVTKELEILYSKNLIILKVIIFTDFINSYFLCNSS